MEHTRDLRLKEWQADLVIDYFTETGDYLGSIEKANSYAADNRGEKDQLSMGLDT